MGGIIYPCTLLSKRFLQKHIKKQEKHKWIHKTVCSVAVLWRPFKEILRHTSCWFLNTLTVEAVTTPACRLFQIFTTLWPKVNLRRSSLDRSFVSYRECPRSLDVSAIWKMSRHWTPSRKPYEHCVIWPAPYFANQVPLPHRQSYMQFILPTAYDARL